MTTSQGENKVITLRGSSNALPYPTYHTALHDDMGSERVEMPPMTNPQPNPFVCCVDNTLPYMYAPRCACCVRWVIATSTSFGRVFTE